MVIQEGQGQLLPLQNNIVVTSHRFTVLLAENVKLLLGCNPSIP